MSNECDATPQTMHGCDKRHRKSAGTFTVLVGIMVLLVAIMGISALTGVQATTAASEATDKAGDVATDLRVHEVRQTETFKLLESNFATLRKYRGEDRKLLEKIDDESCALRDKMTRLQASIDAGHDSTP